MADGFIGNASQKYISTTRGALASARSVRASKPSFSKGGAGSSSGNTDFSSGSDSGDTGGGYRTGMGNSNNIVVSQSAYENVIGQIRQVDAEIAEDLHRISTQIEEMCETIFIAPSTTPKFTAIVGRVKSSLGDFQSLTEDSVMQTYAFTNEIAQIDGR